MPGAGVVVCVIDHFGGPPPRQIANDAIPDLDGGGFYLIGNVAQGHDGTQVLTIGIGQVNGTAVGRQQVPGVAGDALQHGGQVQGGGNVPANFGQDSHFFSVALGFLVKLGIVDGRPHTGGDGAQQVLSSLIESPLLRNALHADDADGLLADHNRYTQIRLGLNTNLLGIQLHLTAFNIPVDQQWLLRLDDAFGQAFTERSGWVVVAIFIREVNHVRLPIVQGHVRNVGGEGPAYLVADQFVDDLNVQLGRQGPLYAVDDRQLGVALVSIRH